MKNKFFSYSKYLIYLPWFFIGAGLILRFTIKDRYPVFSTLYYMTPLPVLIVVLAILIAVAFCKKQKRLMIYHVFLIVGLSIFWFSQSYYNGPEKLVNSNVNIVFWNVGRSNFDAEKIAKVLLPHNPDIIALSESRRLDFDLEEDLKIQFLDYNYLRAKGGLLLIIKKDWDIKHHKYFKFETSRAKLNQFSVQRKSLKFDLAVADVPSNPFLSRKIGLNSILSEVENRKASSMILLGDFNTPFDSVFFDDYRSSLKHAFVEAGKGMIETWPGPIPLLSLDHCWVSPSVQTASCMHLNTLISDHQAVLLRLKLPNMSD